MKIRYTFEPSDIRGGLTVTHPTSKHTGMTFRDPDVENRYSLADSTDGNIFYGAHEVTKEVMAEFLNTNNFVPVGCLAD